MILKHIETNVKTAYKQHTDPANILKVTGLLVYTLPGSLILGTSLVLAKRCSFSFLSYLGSRGRLMMNHRVGTLQLCCSTD